LNFPALDPGCRLAAQMATRPAFCWERDYHAFGNRATKWLFNGHHSSSTVSGSGAAPLMLEHLQTAAEYDQGRAYIQRVASQIGASLG